MIEVVKSSKMVCPKLGRAANNLIYFDQARTSNYFSRDGTLVTSTNLMDRFQLSFILNRCKKGNDQMG